MTGLSGIGAADACLRRLFDDAAADDLRVDRPLLNRMLLEVSAQSR